MERRATGNKDQLTEEYEGRAQAESVLKSHRWLQRQILDKTPRGEHFSSSPFIHKYLSHHYILQRSVVFIVDSKFDGTLYSDTGDIINESVSQFYRTLGLEDYFGYITLDNNKGDELILEKKKFNTHIKQAFLDGREPKYNFKHRIARNRLQIALQTALDWQSQIEENYAETHNDHVYVGPHKWIVCLIGSNGYSSGTFISGNEAQFRNMPNLSISIMAVTENPVSTKMSSQYRKLAESTSEGTFCNLVDITEKQKVENVFQQLFSSMETYPSEDEFGTLYIKENFSIL